MTQIKRRVTILAVASAAIAGGFGSAATAPANAFVCNPIDECEHVPLPVDPTGSCWVSVHAIIDYYDLSGVRCVLHV